MLNTIAHEFAHVYLKFIDPNISHGEEHRKWTKFFLNYLLGKELVKD
ncbi:MAG: hypothetical protein MRECE_18c002 [Mycoplasmataceae bacterium CE_OT135]|nr:MAG: hypothetical protein MRECE_18c002 [Mycoplasmataceae bacterium CE_OT135]